MPAVVSDTSLTYTLDDFIKMQYSDDMTYRNFSILEVVDGKEFLDHNLIDDYLEILEQLCISVPLDNKQYKKYKYAPDLLAYDVYGTVQLDFVILKINGLIDPNDFDMKTVKLPYRSQLKAFLSAVYNKESGYIQQNRYDNGLRTY